jgi:hypothetical protein
MKYTKKALIKLLQDADVSSTAKSIAELLVIALDNGVVKREDILCPEKEKPINVKPKGKKLRGRPRKNPPKEVDPNKVVDPKYHRLRTIRVNPKSVKLTNVDTGEVESYDSLYKACAATRHGSGFFIRNNGKVIDGTMIAVVE